MFCGSHPLGLVIERSSSGMLGLMSGRWLRVQAKAQNQQRRDGGTCAALPLEDQEVGNQSWDTREPQISPPVPSTPSHLRGLYGLR